MLLIPSIIMNTVYFIDMMRTHNDLQIILLPRRIHYTRRDGKKSNSSFHTVVICYQLQLAEKLIVIWL